MDCNCSSVEHGRQDRTSGRLMQTLHGALIKYMNNCVLMFTFLTEPEFRLNFVKTVVLEGMQMWQEKAIQLEK